MSTTSRRSKSSTISYITHNNGSSTNTKQRQGLITTTGLSTRQITSRIQRSSTILNNRRRTLTPITQQSATRNRTNRGPKYNRNNQIYLLHRTQQRQQPTSSRNTTNTRQHTPNSQRHNIYRKPIRQSTIFPLHARQRSSLHPIPTPRPARKVTTSNRHNISIQQTTLLHHHNTLSPFTSSPK